MAEKRVKGPICGIENCRSTKYTEDDDGFLYCQNGHRQHGLVRGVDDEDNFTGASRVITRKQKDTDEFDKKRSKHFSGRQGFDLYLKCLQLILRHQVWFLVNERGLPKELEVIVHDLWALRIAQLADRIASNDEDIDSQGPQRLFSTLESEESETTDNERGTFRKGLKREQRSTSVPNLKDCLALCYLGILTLRLPITPGDIYAWVTDGKIVFQRAITILPSNMRDNLPSTYHAVLDPSLFKYKDFYTATTELQLSMDKTHGIDWPALNVPLLLFRYLKELSLPIELYDATTRLGQLLNFDFALHGKDNKRLGMRHLPEAQLVACLIICVKLLHPFDDEWRQPYSLKEPCATTFDWKDWNAERKAAHTRHVGDTSRFTTEELAKLSEQDVFSMPSDRIDQYLDYYADTFLDEAEIRKTKDKGGFQDAIYKMFPIDGNERHTPILMSDGLSHEESLKLVKSVHEGMMPVAPVSEEDTESHTLRPGQLYPIWKTENDLPETAKVLFEAAARLAGLSMRMLVMAVSFTEARVDRWQREQVKKSRS